MSDTEIESIREQLNQKDVDIFELEERVEELQDELKAYKEFFGYDSDMSLQDMKKYKDECEDEEKVLRETDQEYADQCDKSDKLTDLVINLGEYQYAVAELYAKLKQLSPELNTGLRKNFTSDFIALKNYIPEENIKEFFDLIRNWLYLQHQIHIIDKKIIDARS